MKENWEIKKLGEVCDFQGGSQPPKSQFIYESKEGYVRFLQIRDFASDKNITYIPESKKNRYCNEDDILLGRYGASVGKVLVNKAGAYNVAVMKTIPNETILFKRYLFFYLNSGDFQTRLLNTASRSAQDGFSKDDIFDFPILIPPLPEQQRIVSILDEAFASIAKAKANAEQNLKNAKELFESYLENLFFKLFQTSQKKTVSELAKVIGGYSFKSTDFKKEGKYQVIRMGNVRPGVIRVNENPVFIAELDDKALSKALLLPNDVIITQTGTKKKRDYGFTVIIEKENYLLNQRIASIRFSDKYLSKFFLYFSWTNIFKDQYFANETGTVGQGNVGIGAITDAIVPFIPVKEQKLIIVRIDEIRLETQKLEAVYQKKLDDLEELKKSILQKAFTGELKTEKELAL